MSGSLSPGLELDTITIEPVPQKKGIILRHVEYSVKSDSFRSEVTRRYSDFQALGDLLIYRFPYRLIPRLPPAKLMANIVGVTSDFIELRRKSLERWLTIITSHPVLREDVMTRAFLTDAHSDHASWLREQFRHFPDEFVLSNLGHRAREASSPGLRSEVMGMKGQMASLEEVVKSLAGVTDRLVERRLGDTADIAVMAREIGSVTNNSIFFKDEDKSSSNKNMYYSVSKELSGLGSKMTELGKQLDMKVNQRIQTLGDLVMAYTDMMDRHDKGLLKEHKVATEKIGMIKLRDLRGMLATDIEMRNLAETNISQHEVTLTDLESRQAFALLCLHAEGRVITSFMSTLITILRSMAEIETRSGQEQAEAWDKITSLVNMNHI